MREQRRLTAIVSADVVGYSRLVGRDEAGTVARLRSVRTERLAPVLARRGGRIVKLTGDGALIEFGSAVEALSAAIEFQQTMAENEAERPESERLVYRVGVHLGDVIVDGDDLYGDGVNVAARLEGEAPAGGIVVSRTVHEAVSGRLKATFDDLGSLTLKNIDRPIQAFRVSWEASDWQRAVTVESTDANAIALQVQLPLPDKPSIAVLPFQNMSGDPEQEYFADGMVEDIITELSRFRELFVIARNSSFSYKGKSPDVRNVGRELGVRYVLEGSVRKGGDRIRLTGQLIDTQTGNHIWAERYDRQLDDVFTVQEELTRSIVLAIAPHIAEAEFARARRRAPNNLGAYETALRAKAASLEAWASNDAELCNQALRMAQAALEIDPDSIVAHEAMASVQLWHLNRGTATDREAAWRSGMKAADRMIALDRSYSNGHAWKAMLWRSAPDQGHYDQALMLARHAYELNPLDVLTLAFVALAETTSGDPERAINHIQDALRLSPRDPLRWYMFQQLTTSCFYARRYAESIDYAKRGIVEKPGLTPLHVFLAASHVALGEYEQAKGAMQAARATGAAYVDRIVGGFVRHRDPASQLRLTTFARVAAGLEDPSAAEAVR